MYNICSAWFLDIRIYQLVFLVIQKKCLSLIIKATFLLLNTSAHVHNNLIDLNVVGFAL